MYIGMMDAGFGILNAPHVPGGTKKTKRYSRITHDTLALSPVCGRLTHIFPDILLPLRQKAFQFLRTAGGGGGGGILNHPFFE